MAGDIGNATQTRMVAEQVGEASSEIAIRKFVERYGEPKGRESSVPPPLKWAAAIVAAIMAACATGLLYWMVSTLSAVQITMVRIDERQEMREKMAQNSFAKLEEKAKNNSDRITALEQKAFK